MKNISIIIFVSLFFAECAYSNFNSKEKENECFASYFLYHNPESPSVVENGAETGLTYLILCLDDVKSNEPDGNGIQAGNGKIYFP